ncbi:MAG: NAD kinase [Bacteroidia bacterium]
MKIAIYGRSSKQNLSEKVNDLLQTLQQHQAEIIVFEPFLHFLQKNNFLKVKTETFKTHADIAHSVDYLLSIGGDGTLLETIAFVKNSGIPILGINTGRLGFLANVAKEEIKSAIEALYNKQFTLDKRALLRLETESNLFGDMNYALNEFTVLKKDSSAMMTIHSYIDDEFLNSYWADGLIVSTPTGSTAYSLSCGGPIVMPDSENFIITPIAPHNLNVRPVILPDTHSLKLRVEGRSPHYLVSLDSRTAVIDASIEMTLKKENFKLNLIKFNHQNFLNTIRTKLMWGIDSRN